MARIARESQFTPDEMAIVHVVNRAVRRVFLMGEDRISGNNYDYRKAWIERRIEQLAAYFGIDVLCYSILSNHFHLVLRQRPEVVKSWDDTEVARRWLRLCPQKRHADGSPCEPTEAQLNSIRSDSVKLKEIRSRLSDISWWMRLMCQTIAQRINREDEATGRVFEARYRAVRLLDEAALLACSAYVDLNPIRATMAQTLEQSDYTSVQRRIEGLKQRLEVGCLGDSSDTSIVSSLSFVVNCADRQLDPKAGAQPNRIESVLKELPAFSQTGLKPTCQPSRIVGSRGSGSVTCGIRKIVKENSADRCLAPIHLDELQDSLQVQLSESGFRCSDRGFLNMTTQQYIELLDWTARSLASGKRGVTLADAPPVWQRLSLGISSEAWLELVANFGKLFKLVAGNPHIVDKHRGVKRPKRFKMSGRARELLTA